MLRKSFAILRRAGALRLGLLWYATAVPAVPLLYFLANWYGVDGAREMPWGRVLVAVVVAPLGMFAFFWLVALLLLKFGRR